MVKLALDADVRLQGVKSADEWIQGAGYSGERGVRVVKPASAAEVRF